MFEDSGTTQPVVDGVRRVLRGGAFYSQPVNVRSAQRLGVEPANPGGNYGFRPAMTYP